MVLSDTARKMRNTIDFVKTNILKENSMLNVCPLQINNIYFIHKRENIPDKRIDSQLQLY